ncbi:MAG: dethiobiotin synthase [Calditerrivibrio sp.]|nr:dethiobiotin synthase [Calditerrivibrio sp.]
MKAKLIFITGIDTGVGKTYATGLIAKGLKERYHKVITAKPVQTGSNVIEDIIKHREIMGTELTLEDLNGITCPYLFNYPASPHLSAQMENKTIDKERIKNSLNSLTPHYDFVIIEGAGGAMVPLTYSYLTIDLIKELDTEVVLVTHAKLGSINHTLLTLEALLIRNISVIAMIYNTFFDHDQKISSNFTVTISSFYKNIPIFKMSNYIEDTFFSLLEDIKQNR